MNLRNIAIIAHVDHGKTTLVDQLLKQSGSVRENQHMDERAMEANDSQLEFHHLYASGRNGWAVNELAEISDENKNLDPLFKRIVEDVPPPKSAELAGDEHPFKMLVTTLEADNFLGRILTGRIE